MSRWLFDEFRRWREDRRPRELWEGRWTVEEPADVPAPTREEIETGPTVGLPEADPGDLLILSAGAASRAWVAGLAPTPWTGEALLRAVEADMEAEREAMMARAREAAAAFGASFEEVRTAADRAVAVLSSGMWAEMRREDGRRRAAAVGAKTRAWDVEEIQRECWARTKGFGR